MYIAFHCQVALHKNDKDRNDEVSFFVLPQNDVCIVFSCKQMFVCVCLRAQYKNDIHTYLLSYDL